MAHIRNWACLLYTSDFYNKSGFKTKCLETAFVFLIRPTNYIFKKLKPVSYTHLKPITAVINIKPTIAPITIFRIALVPLSALFLLI